MDGMTQNLNSQVQPAPTIPSMPIMPGVQTQQKVQTQQVQQATQQPVEQPVQQTQAQEVKQVPHISMDQILGASLGEVSNKITVTFKKTVLIRDYETEVIEATTSAEFDEALSGIERMFVSAVLEIQMEYMAYTNLLLKGLVTKTAFDQRKSSLEGELMSIKYKADSLLGEGIIDKYINDYKLTEKAG